MKEILKRVMSDGRKIFLLVGYAGSHNRGAEAILRTTLLMLRTEFKNALFVVSSRKYATERTIDYGEDVLFIPSHSSKMHKRYSFGWIYKQALRVLNSKKMLDNQFLPIVPYLEKAETVISIGGDNYTCDYGSLAYFLNLNKMVKNHGKKLVLWAASIGPFPIDRKHSLIIENLKKADLITVREIETHRYLKNMGFGDNVKATADPAFILNADKEAICDFFRKEHAPTVGLNISPILDKYSKEHDKQKVIYESARFIKKIVESFGVNVLLIPHVIEERCDYDFMLQIKEATKPYKEVKIVPPIYNAAQTKGIISLCDYFIGARTHATIAAISSGVPTISIGYSAKARGINEDIFDGFDFFVDVNDFSAEKLLDKFIQIRENSTYIKKKLSKKIPEMKRLAWKNLDYLKNLLKP